MLRRSQRIAQSLTAAVAVMGAAWFLGAVPALKQCTDQRVYAPTDQPGEHDLSPSRVMLKAGTGCVVHFIDGHSGFFLVLVTGILAVYTYQLFRSTKESGERQLRAYVSFGEITVKQSEVVGGRRIALAYSMANAGQTPAHHLIVTKSFTAIRRIPTPKWHSELRAPVGAPVSLATLMPHETRPVVPSEITLTATEVSGYESADGEFDLHFFARISYRDVFSDLPRHTSLCVRLVWKDRVVASLVIAEHGNDHS